MNDEIHPHDYSECTDPHLFGDAIVGPHCGECHRPMSDAAHGGDTETRN